MASQRTFDIAIIGGGIVGSALAYFLSSSNDGNKVTVIDRSFSTIQGSTGAAPGFVGQLNESEVLTRLAIDSVKEYLNIPGGFDTVGGLEIAASPEAVEKLKSRLKLAKKVGLSAELITPELAARMAPDLVKEDNLLALHFAGDGTASASTIATFYREEASKNGAELIEANVTEICQLDRNISGVMTSSGFIQAKQVIIATGAWAMELCNLDVPVPVIPVAHPYMYGKYHEPNPQKYPFVRWPEYLVYSRDHGPFYGLGSYNHKPLYHKPGETAIGDWAGHFDITLNRALSLIPEKTKLVPREKFNGIFSMTPDNMPLVGKVSSVNGLYMATAVWITHAAGSAKFLIQIMKGETVDVATQRALDPNRFKGRDMESLIKEALDGYNHIYKTQENSE